MIQNQWHELSWLGKVEAALRTPDPIDKIQQVFEIGSALSSDSSALMMLAETCRDPSHQLNLMGIPGIPDRPVLVAPSQVPKRSLGSREGHAAMIHSIAHIEFNAINLALDAVWRFGGMPTQFYWDWLRVAQEEAEHFKLLSDHLVTLGFQYGDFEAHQGLWEMAEKTRHNVLARMAMVPRVLEARGLDASPLIVKKLSAIGDEVGVNILNKILQEEVGHVEIGNYWYYWCCDRAGIIDYHAYWQELALTYQAPRIRPPVNLEARASANFLRTELTAWEQLNCDARKHKMG